VDVSDSDGILTNWRQKVVSAAIIVLAVAVASRVAANLLEPVLPVLVVIVVLGFIGWVLLGKRK
jgi:hypothetical protein